MIRHTFYSLFILVFAIGFRPCLVIGQELPARRMDSLLIHFEGTFVRETRYLMLYQMDTVCIEVRAGKFASYYKVSLSNELIKGDTLQMSFWKAYKIGSKWHRYKKLEMEIVLGNENSDLFVTNRGNRKKEDLNYYWADSQKVKTD